MLGAVDLGIADHGKRAGGEQAAQIAITLLADTAELFFASLECCFGTKPIQAEKSRPDRNAFGSAILATSAVAKAGPTPGISSSRLLVSCDRCQIMIWRSKSRICAFSARSWAPRAATHARATAGIRLSSELATTVSSCSTPLRPIGATIPNSARWAADRIDHRGLLTNEQMPRAMKHQATLLLRRLSLDKPHVGSGNGLADRLSVSDIILLSLDIGPDIGWRHQPHPMPKSLQFLTNDALSRRPPSQRGRAGASQRKPAHSAASTSGEWPPGPQHQRHALENPTSQYIETDCLNCCLHDWLL